MGRIKVIFVVVPVFLFLSSVCSALEPSPTLQVPEAGQNSLTAAGESVSNLLQKANRYYDLRAEPGMAQAAADLYEEILAQKPKDYEASWRSAACYYWMGNDLPADLNKPRELLFSQGLVKAQLALETKPDSLEGNFWCGVLLGEVSNAHGIFASLGAVHPIIASMEKVLTADPNFAFAYHVLGVVYRLAPGWPFSCGNLDKSLVYATQAVATRPDSVLTHLGLGEVLLVQGRKKDAEKELGLALALPGPAELQPETAREKKAVEALLFKINGLKSPEVVAGAGCEPRRPEPVLLTSGK